MVFEMQMFYEELLSTLSSLFGITSLQEIISLQNLAESRDRYCGSHVRLDGKTQRLA